MKKTETGLAESARQKLLKASKAVNEFALGLAVGAFALMASASPAAASALFEISEADAAALTDTVSSARTKVFAIILGVVAFGVVVGLLRGRKRGV